MVIPSDFFVLSFLSSRSVPPILSIPFAFPKSFQFSDVLCNCFYLPYLSSLFSLYVLFFSLSFSLSLSLFLSLSLSILSFNIFFCFFVLLLSLSLSLSLSLYFSLSSLSLSLSPCICLCLPLSVLMGERKGDTKKIKMRETLAKKRLGGNSRRKSQHMRTRRNRILKRAI